MTKSTKTSDTASRLRRDLDSGRGNDKVDYPDPATAPLGTDDEAAGTPITPEQAEMARDQEIRHSARAAPPPDQRPSKTPAIAQSEPGMGRWVMKAIVLAIGLVVIFIIALRA